MPPRGALAIVQKAAPAARERHQHRRADGIIMQPALHGRENAGSFFNEVSTLSEGNLFKDKKIVDARPHCAGLMPSVSPIFFTVAR